MLHNIILNRAWGATGLLCVLCAIAGPRDARAQQSATSVEISALMEYLAYEAKCGEILPIISGPMRPGLIDEKQFDVLTAILPVFIYGYAMNRDLSYDQARFELVDACTENPEKPFAGFPEYRPDPEFWPPDFIEVWKQVHQ